MTGYRHYAPMDAAEVGDGWVELLHDAGGDFIHRPAPVGPVIRMSRPAVGRALRRVWDHEPMALALGLVGIALTLVALLAPSARRGYGPEPRIQLARFSVGAIGFILTGVAADHANAGWLSAALTVWLMTALGAGWIIIDSRTERFNNHALAWFLVALGVALGVIFVYIDWEVAARASRFLTHLFTRS